MAAATSRSGLAEFHGELLVSIAERLDIVDMPKFARTCRKFNSIVHDHKNSITSFAIERQYHRLSEQAHELKFTGLDLVTALRKFSKVQATEATTIRFDRDFVSRCFVALYEGSNRSTRYSSYSPKSMWSLVWTTTGQMAPPHMPTVPQAEIDRVALAKAELWPANVVFNDYRPDAMYVALGDETVRCLGLPNLPRGSGMVYACREDSVYTRLIKANERSKESGTESGRVLMLARLTELVRILPAAVISRRRMW
ncbi:hypothetical protein LTR56_015811 [Elasticomyces elasticus]|nr:hypothetical protein LTR56_015811 [Elasticomyces elasticus]KAK3644095.1 hypothetical protein LTR22_015417 [Elasticomyces elasticus]